MPLDRTTSSNESKESHYSNSVAVNISDITPKLPYSDPIINWATLGKASSLVSAVGAAHPSGEFTESELMSVIQVNKQYKEDFYRDNSSDKDKIRVLMSALNRPICVFHLESSNKLLMLDWKALVPKKLGHISDPILIYRTRQPINANQEDKHSQSSYLYKPLHPKRGFNRKLIVDSYYPLNIFGLNFNKCCHFSCFFTITMILVGIPIIPMRIACDFWKENLIVASLISWISAGFSLFYGITADSLTVINRDDPTTALKTFFFRGKSLFRMAAKNSLIPTHPDFIQSPKEIYTSNKQAMYYKIGIAIISLTALILELLYDEDNITSPTQQYLYQIQTLLFFIGLVFSTHALKIKWNYLQETRKEYTSFIRDYIKDDSGLIKIKNNLITNVQIPPKPVCNLTQWYSAQRVIRSNNGEVHAYKDMHIGSNTDEEIINECSSGLWLGIWFYVILTLILPPILETYFSATSCIQDAQNTRKAGQVIALSTSMVLGILNSYWENQTSDYRTTLNTLKYRSLSTFPSGTNSVETRASDLRNALGAEEAKENSSHPLFTNGQATSQNSSTNVESEL